MANFNELFAKKVYPKLQEGLHKVILTGLGSITPTKKADGTLTEYLPIHLEVIETGRPIIFNIFSDSFEGFLISPIQSQIDPDNTKIWEGPMDLISELMETKTQLNCWVQRKSYIAKDGNVKTTTNYLFAEPKETSVPQTQLTNTATLEEINF